MRKQPNSVHSKAIEVWMTYYQNTTGEKYVFQGAKDGTAIKQLIKKVESKCKDKNIDTTEENVLNSLRGFLSSLKDKWILENLDLAIVNSKFNVIYAKAIRNNPFTRQEQVNDIIRDKYGADPKRAAG